MYNDIFPFPPLSVYDVTFTGDAVVKMTEKYGARRGSDSDEMFDDAAITFGSGSSRSLSAKGGACLYTLCIYNYVYVYM